MIFGGSLVISWYKHHGHFAPVLLRRSPTASVAVIDTATECIKVEDLYGSHMYGGWALALQRLVFLLDWRSSPLTQI